MTNIYLIRHAESDGNIAKKLCGHTNSDVTERGMIQLSNLSERFKAVQIDKIYASPLKRAKKTAEAVNRFHGLDITFDDNLKELYAGDWEAQPYDVLKKDYKDDYEIWCSYPHLFKSPNGESMAECYERIVNEVKKLAGSNDGKTIVIVSHGCVLRNLMCYLKGLPHEKLGSLSYMENTGVTLVQYDKNAFAIVRENDSSHLSNDLQTVAHQDWWNDFVVLKTE